MSPFKFFRHYATFPIFFQTNSLNLQQKQSFLSMIGLTFVMPDAYRGAFLAGGTGRGTSSGSEGVRTAWSPRRCGGETRGGHWR